MCIRDRDGVNKKNDVNNTASEAPEKNVKTESEKIDFSKVKVEPCLLYTSPSPRDRTRSRMPSSAWKKKRQRNKKKKKTNTKKKKKHRHITRQNMIKLVHVIACD